MRVKTLILVAAFLCAIAPASVPALALTVAQQAAVDYEYCIISLKNLDPVELTGILKGTPDRDKAGAIIADKAVKSCRGEKAKLENLLNYTGTMDEKHAKGIADLEKASKYSVKLVILNQKVDDPKIAPAPAGASPNTGAPE
jgi:hypothetical protein